jgi:hypothetical protein
MHQCASPAGWCSTGRMTSAGTCRSYATSPTRRPTSTTATGRVTAPACSSRAGRCAGGGDWRKHGLTSGSAQSYTTTLGVNRITRFNMAFVGAGDLLPERQRRDGGESLGAQDLGAALPARLGIDPVIRLQVSLNPDSARSTTRSRPTCSGRPGGA